MNRWRKTSIKFVWETLVICKHSIKPSLRVKSGKWIPWGVTCVPTTTNLWCKKWTHLIIKVLNSIPLLGTLKCKWIVKWLHTLKLNIRNPKKERSWRRRKPKRHDKLWVGLLVTNTVNFLSTLDGADRTRRQLSNLNWSVQFPHVASLIFGSS